MSSTTIEETLDRVGHQTTDGHRSHSSRYWGDNRSLGFDGSEVHVTAEFAVFIQVHSDIYHSSSFLYHVSGHEFCLSDSGDQYVSLSRNFR